MARPGRFDHLKPEIFRLIAEGMTFSQILKIHPEISKGTLSLWFSAVNNIGSEPVQNDSEPVQNPPKPPRQSAMPAPRLRLPIDPESPLEKIKNALWDIVYNPEGKGTAVQALNILLRIEAPYLMGVAVPAEEEPDNDREIVVTRQIVDAHASD
jgi:hypothetical protein